MIMMMMIMMMIIIIIIIMAYIYHSYELKKKYNNLINTGSTNIVINYCQKYMFRH